VASEDDKVVGHILFSVIVIETKKGDVPVLSLAPMSILPEYQNRGIGSELVRHGLKECQRLGHQVIVVIGHPKYYPRFGFKPAKKKGLKSVYPVPDEAFMVLELTPGALEGVSGSVRFPPAFDDAM